MTKRNWGLVFSTLAIALLFLTGCSGSNQETAPPAVDVATQTAVPLEIEQEAVTPIPEGEPEPTANCAN
jgi:PBP1b-binding outer membrane lipoprotein LpoB